MESLQGEKITVDSLTNKLKIEDKDAFYLYLKEVWIDLYSRVKENKNDKNDAEINLNGVTKLIFDKYFILPGIIGDRFFKVLDQKNTSVLSANDFIKGMTTLYCGGYEETVKFIFNFYDMDNDGIIDKEDIRVVLSYITLADSPDVKSTGLNITYQKRVTSQEEIYSILQKCFENIPNNKMDFITFKNTIENVNSDIYLMIYLFLLENKPFTKENIKSYKSKIKKNETTEKDKEKEKEKKVESKLIMSPSKNSSFSPYKAFARAKGKRKTTVVQKEIDFMQLLKSTNQDEKEEFQSKIVPSEFKRKGKKRRTVQYESNVMSLQEIQEEELKKKNIKQERLKDLVKKKIKKDEITDEQIQIKPAFKQKIKKKSTSKSKPKNKNNNKNILNEKPSLRFNDDSEESDDESDSSSEEEEEEDEDILKYEGTLYKLVDGKMRDLYFKLIHKDLYFYKNKGDAEHKGMHNLNGLFLQKEQSVEYEGATYYSFSVVYPSKTRVYYCKDKKEYDGWIEKLKIATGYTNLLEIYDVKNKLGSGKFGLVKLGIHKKTGQKVAIKIMKKSSMDSSDLELVRTEIEILKICQHPNIIRLYNVFENADYLYIIMEYCYGGDLFSYLENRHFRVSEKRASNIINIDYIYIIMEYCPGGDLFSYLEKRKFQIPEERAAIIMNKMCEAVFYFQSYFGVIHRDLKPENILMTSNDDNGDIRILDFGLSKISTPNEKCTEPYGTLTYCAPEIILDEPYNKEVDMWSLGVMTYLMVSGRLPFNAEDENKIARQIAFGEPDFENADCWKKISKECVSFIKKKKKKDPKKRMLIGDALKHDWFKKFIKKK